MQHYTPTPEGPSPAGSPGSQTTPRNSNRPQAGACLLAPASAVDNWVADRGVGSANTTKWAEARCTQARWRSTRQPLTRTSPSPQAQGCNSALSDMSSGHARRRAASPVWTVLGSQGRQDSSQCLLVSPLPQAHHHSTQSPEGGPLRLPHSLKALSWAP